MALAANATISLEQQRLYEKSDAVLRAEIDLERYYLNYRLIANTEPRWRRWRYFLGQSTGAAMFVASDSTNVVEFTKSLNDPVSNSVLRNSYVTGMVGSIIGSVSDGVEMASNVRLAVKNLQKKNNPAAAVAEYKSRLNQIDALLKERAALLAASPNDESFKLNEAEGKVLRAYRNWCVFELADIYAGVKSFQSSNNLYYLSDLAAYLLYVVSYKYALDAINRVNANAPSAITGIVGGVIFAENFALSTLTAKILYKRAFRKLEQTLGEKIYDAQAEANKELLQLEMLSKDCSANTLESMGPLSQRIAVYRLWSQRFDEFLDKQTRHLRRMSRVALQSQVSGPLIAGTYIAQDTLTTVGFYRYRNNDRVSQRLGAAGCISGAAGSGVSFLLSNQGFIQDLIYLRKLRREKNTPEDLIAKRLEALKELESLLDQKEKEDAVQNQ